MVPLAGAWRSGADGWTAPRREAFANDLDGPELIAVTDDVNQSKGDRSPDQWMPPAAGYWCTYASMWIHVKSTWGLTATNAEVTALDQMLETC